MDSDQAITTAEEFNETLNELMRAAYDNEVDVEGGWECCGSDGDPDWDVVILEITKRARSGTE